ncbi:MAG: chloride channel protein [Fulvivirga sp.]
MARLNKFQLLFLKWRRKQRNNRIFPFILSIVVGLVVGLAAIFIKTLIYYIEQYAVYFLPRLYYFILPLIGFLLVTLLNRTVFRQTAYFNGFRDIIKAIEQHSSFIRFRLTFSKFITTGLTIGFGGSSGLESAIVTSGSAIGSNIGKFLGLGYRLRTLLIGCGVAAGISAIYNAPIGGFIFALEAVLPEFTPTLLIPLLVAAATGKILFEFIMGDQLRFEAPITEFTYEQIPLVIILGVLAMLMSQYLILVYSYCYRQLSKVGNSYIRALAGGIVLGTIIYLLPPMFGEGYVSINAILSNEEDSLFSSLPFQALPLNPYFNLAFFFLLMIFKPISTGICVNSGGEGGYFAPSIITGGFLGYFFYKVVTLIFPQMAMDANTYVFLGMAGVFACVMKAPVTAIFLIAEITQSYQLFVPLMLICAIAYFLKYYNENLRASVIQSKESKTLRSERIILNQIHTHNLIERDLPTTSTETSLRVLIEKFSNSQWNIIAVVDENNKLEGVISINDIRQKLSDLNTYDSTFAKDIMQPAVVTVGKDEPAAAVMEKFDAHNVWYLPVVDKGKFEGFIPKTKLITQYRKELTRTNRFF